MTSSEEQVLLAKWRKITRGKIFFGGVVFSLGLIGVLAGHRIIWKREGKEIRSRFLEAQHRIAQTETTTALERKLVDQLIRGVDLYEEQVTRGSELLIGVYCGAIAVFGSTLLIGGLSERRRLAQLEKLRGDPESAT